MNQRLIQSQSKNRNPSIRCISKPLFCNPKSSDLILKSKSTPHLMFDNVKDFKKKILRHEIGRSGLGWTQEFTPTQFSKLPYPLTKDLTVECCKSESGCRQAMESSPE